MINIPNSQHVNDILNAKALTPKRTPKKSGRKPKALKDGDKMTMIMLKLQLNRAKVKENCAQGNKNHNKYTY